MSRALLNGLVSGSSGFGKPPGLKIGECVKQLICIAKDIARTQPDTPIDARDGLVRPSS